ncbi:MATE family efflux transporter [Chakrabartyella piscis]|uniref:MATE family efflux transporter n=1 Tax=Chakrabartyella piscis TaxID=2918914 RepID=UPI002958C4AF|nr:MATE family efflux transporter [Chakrabartyella piscis]
MNENLEKMESMTPVKAVMSNAIPAMLIMVMALVYNMADLFFIGRTGNDLMVAAISLAAPLFLMFMALGNVFGIGGASLLSRCLGKGDKDASKKISSFCFWSCICIGILLSVVVFFSVDSLAIAFGASSDTADMVSNYLAIISTTGVFVLISSCYSALVRSEGKPQKAMTGMVLGNLINIVLDPILILGLNMGVEGAAIATAIGNLCGGAYYLIYLLKADTMLTIKPRDFTCKEGILKEVLLIGIPASLTSILMGICQILINSQMSVYGDLAVAGIGVGMKVTMITTMMCMGIGLGVQPLLSYAIGAGNKERYNSIFKVSVIFAVILSGGLTILCYLTLHWIVNAFVSDPQAYEYAYYFSGVLISTSVAFSVLSVLANALQAAGAATSALIVNTSRQGFVYIPLLFIMGNIWNIDGLVFAQPVADVISIVLAIVLYLIVSKKFFASSEAI